MSTSVWNVPNRLSAARIVFAIACFGCLSWGYYLAALGLFAVAAATDWLDGYWARRFDQVTQLGRILDPFADKLLICGVFVYLAAIPTSHVPAWAAVVVIARELLVTALRSFIESHGGDCSAKWAGKWKMVLQCATVVASLWSLTVAEPPSAWLSMGVRGLVGATVVLTLLSGWEHVQAAIGMQRPSETTSANSEEAT